MNNENLIHKTVVQLMIERGHKLDKSSSKDDIFKFHSSLHSMAYLDAEIDVERYFKNKEIEKLLLNH